MEQILQQYPGLEEADILASIAYGAEMGDAGIAMLRLPPKPSQDGLFDAMHTLIAGLVRREIAGKLWSFSEGAFANIRQKRHGEQP